MKVGIDIVKVERFLDKINDGKFLSRVFTHAEREHIKEISTPQGQAERMAGKFCAKEAVSKMFGTGIDKGITWLDIEILPDSLGKPCLNLKGTAKKMAESLKLKNIDISISHTDKDAIAICVAM